IACVNGDLITIDGTRNSGLLGAGAGVLGGVFRVSSNYQPGALGSTASGFYNQDYKAAIFGVVNLVRSGTASICSNTTIPEQNNRKAAPGNGRLGGGGGFTSG